MFNSKPLESFFDKLCEQKIKGCSFTLYKENEKLMEYYNGFADGQTKISPQTIFRIYSMTKPVTCAVALKLMEQGMFHLKEPVAKYLPEFSNPKMYVSDSKGLLKEVSAPPILIEHLFTMTSGLTYGNDKSYVETQTRALVKAQSELFSSNKSMTTSEATEKIAKLPLAFAPGSHWQYGLSHDVIAALVEKLTGKSFAEVYKTELFDPLGMEDTFFILPEQKQGRLAALYVEKPDGSLVETASRDVFYSKINKNPSGGAGLLSTLGDYTKFARMLTMDGSVDGVRILSERTAKLMRTNFLSASVLPDTNMPGFGYGLGVSVCVDTVKAASIGSLGEFGWSGIAGTWVVMDPEERISAVYMQQRQPCLDAEIFPIIRNLIYGNLG